VENHIPFRKGVVLMRIVKGLMVLGLVLAFASGASAGQKAAKKAKNGAKAVHGVVTAVGKDSVTVKVKQGKKQGGGTTEKTFKLGSATKYETVKVTKVKGQKPQKETADASLSTLATGNHVQIVADGETASKVSIVEGKKGKAKKKAA
jgi:hypothetical protein